MSQISSRTRPDKGQAMPPQPPPSSQTVEVVNASSAQLTEFEWLSVTSQEEGEGFVVDILDDLINRVTERCYEKGLKNKLVPYTLTWARNSIVQVMNWQYLLRDEGDEENVVLLLQEDPEPSPLTIDSWAEGCVPVIQTPHPPQELQFDAQEADLKDPQHKHSSDSLNETETTIKEPTVERTRSGRAVKLIPATHTLYSLSRKPQPPEIPSPNRPKPPKEYITVPAHID